ncbi:MAG: acetate--CoA ligase [Myxococcales bacterium]|nr:acetate--CoA ligase [Myxococcales bacterium]
MSDIESVLTEDRTFEAPEAFAKDAHVKSLADYDALYKRADEDPEGYWSDIAGELHWHKAWDSVLDWKVPDAKWFVGAETNIAYNCLDHQIAKGLGDKTAILFEGEPGDVREISFFELHRDVSQFSNVLLGLGVNAGDRVAIYMPMVPEAAVAMLACARIGAVHSVIFGGFSASSLSDRILDAGIKTVITADGSWRRGSVLALKENVDEALKTAPVENVVVLKRCDNDVAWQDGRDHWWHGLVAKAEPTHTAPALDAEHPLFILYTSGTTGKPKGILHTTGGYMVGAYQSTKLVFDIKDDDIFWCTADVGWVTGHTYVVYGALLNGTTTLMYEGAPNHPEPDRFWELIAKHKATILYTAPTAIRAFMRWGDEWPKKHNLSSLRLLGTVGEPINPSAWMWYREVIGGERCPIVDTWWQTETGSIMLSPLPGAIATKPGSCTRPLPGVSAKIVDEEGKECAANHGGFLVLDKPWPSMLRTLYGDHERFVSTYFGEVEGKYFAGDGARCDEDGYFWVMGRVDDVINVSGHRLSTMEVESALVSHEKVAEAAVVAKPHELKGQAIVAFVTPMKGVLGDAELGAELRAHVATQIGALARPEEVHFADGLPKTRSGKIMRRLLRDLASGQGAHGDVTTLEDASILAKLAANYDDEE